MRPGLGDLCDLVSLFTFYIGSSAVWAELHLYLSGVTESLRDGGSGGRVHCLSEKLEVLAQGIVPAETVIRLQVG